MGNLIAKIIHGVKYGIIALVRREATEPRRAATPVYAADGQRDHQLQSALPRALVK
jgi:hypothetical protein